MCEEGCVVLSYLSDDMMRMVSHMNSFDDKLNFLRKYDYHDKELEMLKSHEKFAEAAGVYLKMGNITIS